MSNPYILWSLANPCLPTFFGYKLTASSRDDKLQVRIFFTFWDIFLGYGVIAIEM